MDTFKGGLTKTLSNMGLSRIADEINEDDSTNYIRRDHWKSGDFCSRKDCRRSLIGIGGVRIGSNCRRCGLAFCDTHLDYRIKLSYMAEHDPDNGFWSRVCEQCFTDRKGYREYNGKTRSRNLEFTQLRQRRIDRLNLEANRLEKRVQKLTEIHQQFRGTPVTTPHGSPLQLRKTRAESTNTQRFRSLREAEQSITPWQPDAEVSECPLCHVPFGRFSNRKHHCRLCGRIVCAKDTCAQLVPLFSGAVNHEIQPDRGSRSASGLSSRASSNTEASTDQLTQQQMGNILVCKDCKSLTFRRRQHVEELAQKPAIVKLYDTLSATRKEIERLLPTYNENLMSIQSQDTEIIATDYRLQEKFRTAAQVRKQLLDLFAEFDLTSKRINALSPATSCHQRVQAGIFNASNMFLQNNMFTLQLLPKLMPERPKHQQLKEEEILTVKSGGGVGGNEQMLTILHEQKVQVEEYIREATRQRKFDDVQALQINLDEINREISRIKL